MLAQNQNIKWKIFFKYWSIVPAFLGNNSKYYDLENASFLTHNNCLLRPILIGLQTYFGRKMCCPSFSYNINLLFHTF